MKPVLARIVLVPAGPEGLEGLEDPEAVVEAVARNIEAVTN